MDTRNDNTARGCAKPPDHLIVKWKTPTDEAIGIAQVAGALVERRIAEPGRIAIMVPNRLWAANLQAACKSCGARATLCVPHPELARSLGDPPETDLKGFSLVRHLQWGTDPRLAHALLHVQGFESASEVFAIVKEQLERPTVPAFTEHIPIVLQDYPSVDADYLFAVACVRGLVPHGEGTDESKRAFAGMVSERRERTFISYFTKAPLELAEAAGIYSARRKTEDGKPVAMTQPSPYLEAAGIWRPTTTGGQALLRTYGLN